MTLLDGPLRSRNTCKVTKTSKSLPRFEPQDVTRKGNDPGDKWGQPCPEGSRAM